MDEKTEKRDARQKYVQRFLQTNKRKETEEGNSDSMKKSKSTEQIAV